MNREMNNFQKPSISACMIVKNEEKLLPLCLKSIKDYVDEIVIVDTGSTDNTVSIAKSFGARVYHHPWENHFSKHRNQSFSYANGQWILYIDADEELLPGSGEILRQAVLVDDDVDAVAVVLECIFDGGGSIAQNNAIRMFRNDRGLHYKGRVHNHIVGVKKAICAPIHIFHHGYNLDKETMRRKFKRTSDLLKKEIEENPADPRPHHFLGASYLSENLFKEAVEEALKAVDLYEKRKTTSHNYLWSLYIASSAHFRLGEINKSEALAEKGLAVYPDHVDSHYMLAMVAYAKKDRNKFEYHFRRYLKAKDSFQKDPARFGELVNNTFGSEWVLYLFRGFFRMDEGQEDRAQKELEQCRRLCPDLSLYFTKLGRYFKASGRLSEAEAEYLRALELRPEDPQAIWLVSEVYEELDRPLDQVAWLTRLVKIAPEFPNGQFALGLAQMQLGNLEEALAIFKEIRVENPKNLRARINEAMCLRGMQRYDESIRLLQGLDFVDDPEKLAIMSNLAKCHYEKGEEDSSAAYFAKMAEMAPDALEPYVYLARLGLAKGEVEACVSLCGRILLLLDMKEHRTLHSLAELGALFAKAGKAMSSSLNARDLAGICFEMGAMLGHNMAETAMDTGWRSSSNDPMTSW